MSAQIENSKLASPSPEKSTTTETLTQEETRQILTPFAFEIDKSLFGLALASPFKRAGAIFIDLCLIALLSDIPGEILAVLIAITLYKVSQKSHNIDENTPANKTIKSGLKKGGRSALKALAIFIVFIVLLDVLPHLFTSFDKQSTTQTEQSTALVNVSGKPLELTESISFAALSSQIIINMNNSDCMWLACWQEELTPMVRNFAVFDLSPELLGDASQEIVEATELTSAEQQKLKATLINEYQLALDSLTNNEYQLASKPNNHEVIAPSVIDKNINDSEADNRPAYSVIKWIQGIIEDLGLGFGWAAFYFTVLTTVFKGKTVGKKLFGIRVLHLNGKRLTLWESFSRYGGYGAGIATGLLGFIQIFWNPNRQAIQDQISSTVVIDDRS